MKHLITLAAGILAAATSPLSAESVQSSLAETPVEFTPGKAVALSALAPQHSQVFQISDADRPGSWCWFQDPRAIVDASKPDNPILVTGVVTYAAEGNDARGDIDLYWAELGTLKKDGSIVRGRFELDDRLQMDDHASPAFMIRPDGRYLVNWSMHGNDAILRTRISTNPGDPRSWGDTLRTKPTGNGICYTNPRYLAGVDGGTLFSGVRSKGFDSNFILSKDLGETWSYGGRVLDALDPWPNDPDGGRAYVKYAGDGKSRIYIISTDDHPGVNFNDDRTAKGPNLNSIYAGYIEGDKLHRIDGAVIDENVRDDVGTPPTKLTVLLKDGTKLGKDAMRRGWMDSFEVTPEGFPVGIFQFRANDNKDDHRYFYARHDGKQFHVNFLAYAGSNFGRQDQPDYTGLAAVDPMNPDVVFISTSADPVTGKVLVSTATGKRQHEIFMGKTSDQGKTWQWAAVTENSPTDNIRPVVPAWIKGKSVVLWMRGSYPEFYQYDTAIVGQTFDYIQP